MVGDEVRWCRGFGYTCYTSGRGALQAVETFLEEDVGVTLRKGESFEGLANILFVRGQDGLDKGLGNISVARDFEKVNNDGDKMTKFDIGEDRGEAVGI